MSKEASISLSDLDLTAKSEKAFEVEIINPKNEKPMGVFISVFGDHSDKVKSYIRRELNQRRRQAALFMKKGKDIEIETLEDDEAFTVESCVIRTSGWRGIKESFSEENARLLYTTNPVLRQQVLAASGNVANFM